MTLDVYADLFDEDLDGVADRLDTAIKSAAGALRTGYRSLTSTNRPDLLKSCGAKGVELRGFEPQPRPGEMPIYLQVRSVSFRFSPVRYLRLCFRVLTASRVDCCLSSFCLQTQCRNSSDGFG
jgi:hypothetical protein